MSDWQGIIGCPEGSNAFKFGEPGYYSFLHNADKKLGNESTSGTDYAAVLKAIDFMNNSPPEPFVIFLPGIGSHPPYGAPKDYHDM